MHICYARSHKYIIYFSSAICTLTYIPISHVDFKQLHDICRSIHRLQHTKHGTGCTWWWNCGCMWYQWRLPQHRQTILDRGTIQIHCLIIGQNTVLSKGLIYGVWCYCVVSISADQCRGFSCTKVNRPMWDSICLLPDFFMFLSEYLN